MWKKYAIVHDHRDRQEAAAEDVPDGALARRPSETAGSAATVAWPIFFSVRLIFSSASFGCLRASQCTDSGMKK